MPVMNGYDTCVEIRNLIKNKKITSPMHVVAVTADVEPNNIFKLRVGGFDSVVEKPIYKKTLEKILYRYLDSINGGNAYWSATAKEQRDLTVITEEEEEIV